MAQSKRGSVRPLHLKHQPLSDRESLAPGRVPVEEEWDIDTNELIAWFLTTTPPAEPFELCRGVTILDPARWWQSVRSDIESGPAGPRARYGAVQNELRNLAAQFRIS